MIHVTDYQEEADGSGIGPCVLGLDSLVDTTGDYPLAETDR